jgi:flagellar hook-associated protein FliD
MSTTSIGASVLAGSQSDSTSGGLGAGIDVSALVQAALAPQQAELAVLQGDQTTITNEQTALNNFNNDLQTLQNAVFALTDPAGQLTDADATSSNSAVLTASATAGTPAGSHTIHGHLAGLHVFGLLERSGHKFDAHRHRNAHHSSGFKPGPDSDDRQHG